MSDELERIKGRYRMPDGDIDWLIGEVERLRRLAESHAGWVQAGAWVELRDENARLRAVLSALCDATEGGSESRVILDAIAFDKARAVAVAVLQGEPQ